MGMLGAAFAGGENLELFVLRADGFEQLWCLVDLDHLVILSVGDEIGALDVAGDAGQAELFRDIQLVILVFGAHYPAPLERVGVAWLARLPVLLGLELPRVHVPVRGGERHARYVAHLERRDARGPKSKPRRPRSWATASAANTPRASHRSRSAT